MSSKKYEYQYVWSCCQCGDAGMSLHSTVGCPSCGLFRCRNCPVQQCKVLVDIEGYDPYSLENNVLDKKTVQRTFGAERGATTSDRVTAESKGSESTETSSLNELQISIEAPRERSTAAPAKETTQRKFYGSGSQNARSKSPPYEDSDSGSVFSDNESIFSSMESNSSKSSIQGNELAALREFVTALFTNDEELKAAFTIGLREEGVGAEVMTRESARALRVMGKALRRDAKSIEQRYGAKRVSADSKYIAYSLRKNQDPEFAARRLDIDKSPMSVENQEEHLLSMVQRMRFSRAATPGQSYETGVEDDSDASDADDVDREADLKLLLWKKKEMEDFIIKSGHMKILKEHLRILSQTELGMVAQPGNLQDDRRAHIWQQVGPSLPEIIDWWTPRWFDWLLEPSVAPGVRRVRWTCACGKRLYDDYKDLDEEQLHKLGGMLSGWRQLYNDQSGARGSPSMASVSHITTWAASVLSNAANIFRRNQETNSGIPLHNSATECPQNRSPVIQNAQRDSLFLLLSLQAGGEGSAKVLRHANVETSKLENDNDLFRFLRQEFHAERKLSSRLSLRTVSGVGNCMFWVDCSSFIQSLQRHSSACPAHSVFCCGCWPTSSAVSEYRYIPHAPTEPFLMEKNYLLHHFRNPGCLDPRQKSVICYVPIKKDSQLVGEVSKPVTGWGIYFEEDWHWKTIFVVITVLMIIVSIVLGLTWWFVKSDFSGGWGVASFCVTSATLVVTVLGFMAHKS